MIRNAKHQDIEQVAILTSALGYPTSTDEMKTRYDKFLSNDGYGIYVYTVEDKVVGYIAWSMCKSIVYDKVRFHIEAIVVDEKHRGQGIGKKLIAALESHVSQFSPTVIDLTSGAKRASSGTPEFYKSIGYINEGNTAKFYFRKEII